MVLQAVGLDRPEGRAPGRDGREAAELPRGRRPLLEHDRRTGVAPVQPARGDRAADAADVLADGEVDVVHRDLLDPAFVPELGETRVDVDEGSSAEAPPYLVGADVAAHVHE